MDHFNNVNLISYGLEEIKRQIQRYNSQSDLLELDDNNKINPSIYIIKFFIFFKGQTSRIFNSQEEITNKNTNFAKIESRELSNKLKLKQDVVILPALVSSNEQNILRIQKHVKNKSVDVVSSFVLRGQKNKYPIGK